LELFIPIIGPPKEAKEVSAGKHYGTSSPLPQLVVPWAGHQLLQWDPSARGSSGMPTGCIPSPPFSTIALDLTSNPAVLT